MDCYVFSDTDANQPFGYSRSASTKPRRPDRAVYVPRALRSSDTSSEENKPPDTRKRTNNNPPAPHAKSPKSPRDKSQPGTPRKSLDKTFCNVYTPPHLRSQRSQTDETVETQPNSDSAIEYTSDTDPALNISDNFYIGDYFAKGQLGLYSPGFYYGEKDHSLEDSELRDLETNGLNMAVPESNRRDIIDNVYGLSFNKDEDVEQNVLRRASEEINRSSKRIIKQSFDTDVLVISDPVEEPAKVEPTANVKRELPPPKPKQKLEAKVSLKREENDWDAVFDDSGECLDPSLLEELTATVGKVQISRAKNNYEEYQTRGQQLCSGAYDESFGHVVEVFDFPSEFKTNDLLSVFSEYKDTGFEIKWVDDTHALIVFSSAKIGEFTAFHYELGDGVIAHRF